MTEEIQQQYPYSVKIEQTALGARVSVHVYENNRTDVIAHAISLYRGTREFLERQGFKIAPEEPAAAKQKENGNK